MKFFCLLCLSVYLHSAFAGPNDTVKLDACVKECGEAPRWEEADNEIRPTSQTFVKRVQKYNECINKCPRPESLTPKELTQASIQVCRKYKLNGKKELKECVGQRRMSPREFDSCVSELMGYRYDEIKNCITLKEKSVNNSSRDSFKDNQKFKAITPVKPTLER